MIRRMDLMFVRIGFDQLTIDIMFDTIRRPEDTMYYPVVIMRKALRNMCGQVMNKSSIGINMPMQYKLGIQVFKYLSLWPYTCCPFIRCSFLYLRSGPGESNQKAVLSPWGYPV